MTSNGKCIILFGTWHRALGVNAHNLLGKFLRFFVTLKFGSWRPTKQTKQNYTQFGDPFITITFAQVLVTQK